MNDLRTKLAELIAGRSLSHDRDADALNMLDKLMNSEPSSLVDLCRDLMKDYGDELRAEASKGVSDLIAVGDIPGLIVRNGASAVIRIAETGDYEPEKILKPIGQDIMDVMRADTEAEQRTAAFFGAPPFLTFTGAYYYARAFPGEFEVVETMFLFPARLSLEKNCQIHRDKASRYEAAIDHFRLALILSPMKGNGYPQALADAAKDVVIYMLMREPNINEVHKITSELNEFVGKSKHADQMHGIVDQKFLIGIKEFSMKLGGAIGIPESDISDYMTLVANMLFGHFCILTSANDDHNKYREIMSALQRMFYTSKKRPNVKEIDPRELKDKLGDFKPE